MMAFHRSGEGEPSVPQTELYEELDRLPDRYRAPLVLCHLEGLTHEQAAQRLRCPVRTVETRLVRGRTRLRERLLRRGVVPSAVLACATTSAPGRLPVAWAEATVRAGLVFTHHHATAVGIIATPALALAEGVLNAMFLKQLGLVTTSLLIVSGLAAGGALWANPAAPRPDPSPPPSRVPAPSDRIPDAEGAEAGNADSLQPEISPPEPGPRPSQADRPKAKNEARELALDDGQMKGRRSIAGGGHAVRFETPGEGWVLTAVRIHGSRYGYPRPPQEDFKVFLCDDHFQPVAEFAFPYAKFERGNTRWVTLEVKPTRLPRRFILGVGFNPTQTKGVYLSHDAQGNGRSLVGLPGDEPRPFEQGDWLIRAKVEPGR